MSRTFGATYPGGLAAQLADPETIPLWLLLQFHHLRYDTKLERLHGLTLFEAFTAAHADGLAAVRGYAQAWASLESRVDARRHLAVQKLLQIGATDASNFSSVVISWFRDMGAGT